MGLRVLQLLPVLLDLLPTDQSSPSTMVRNVVVGVAVVLVVVVGEDDATPAVNDSIRGHKNRDNKNLVVRHRTACELPEYDVCVPCDVAEDGYVSGHVGGGADRRHLAHLRVRGSPT